MFPWLCLLIFRSRDQAIFAPFIHLPPRTLVDYYKIIRHPVSLKSVQKLVRGIKGREPPTGSTFLKSWHAFEEEVGYIWKNARDYNEDGSDLFVLSEKLEVRCPPPEAQHRLLIYGPVVLLYSIGRSKTICRRASAAKGQA